MTTQQERIVELEAELAHTRETLEELERSTVGMFMPVLVPELEILSRRNAELKEEVAFLRKVVEYLVTPDKDDK